MELTANIHSSLTRIYTFSPPHSFTHTTRLHIYLQQQLRPKFRPVSIKTTPFRTSFPKTLKQTPIISKPRPNSIITTRLNKQDIPKLATEHPEIRVFPKGLVVLAVLGCAVIRCRRAFALEQGGVLAAGGAAYLRSVWPKVLQVLLVFKEQGLILAALLGLSAFFSMAETSITTLWPWKVCV